MNRETETVLTKIAQALNASHVLWGVGASLLLYQYKLVESPSDIDLIVSTTDTKTVDRILSALGAKQEETPSDIYATEYFYEYIIDGISIDVMAGLKINLNHSVFEYIFDKESIPNKICIQNQLVPFSTLEDWYVLYQLMPGKEFKADLIANYFHQHGIQHPSLLERITETSTLPANIKEKAKF